MLLKEKLEKKELILASRSPRRRALLEGCGLDFTLAPDYEVEEVWPPGTAALEVPLFLARLKSEAYPRPLDPGQILITADTVVILGGEILGKPEGRDGAVEMLEKMSGQRHTVATGVVMRSGGGREDGGNGGNARNGRDENGRVNGFTATTEVWFRRLRREEIEYYVDTYKPYDKAGAYGIQEWIGYAAIERIEGSFYNVMGLPIQTLYINLEKFIDE